MVAPQREVNIVYKYHFERSFYVMEVHVNGMYYCDVDNTFPYTWEDGRPIEVNDFERWLDQCSWSPKNKFYEGLTDISYEDYLEVRESYSRRGGFLNH